MDNIKGNGSTFIVLILLAQYVDSYYLKFSIQSYTLRGIPCMTDCHNGWCYTSSLRHELCTLGYQKAPIYFTTRDRYTISECQSKCVFGSESFSWCYVTDYGDWDYCSPETRGVSNWYEYTKNYGRCKNGCEKRGTSYYWCNTFWSSPDWDYCDEDIYYYAETANTIYRQKCLGDCERFDMTYFWCYDETKTKTKCAPSALPRVCRKKIPTVDNSNNSSISSNSSNISSFSTSSDLSDFNNSNYSSDYNNVCNSTTKPDLNNQNLTRTTRGPPRRTVAEYNQDIDDLVENDPNVHTVTLSIPNQPVIYNPILDYTYRNYNGLRLPLRVRAIIYPFHINRDPRRGRGISTEARRNCEAMGLNTCLPNGNNDQCGHMIPYILKGPDQWYNIVPQTRRINVGTSGHSDIESPSIWAITERSIRRAVDRGGHVEFNVLIAYDLPTTRPTGFGVTERYFSPNDAVDFECMGYWYSNDPYQDPDEWN